MKLALEDGRIEEDVKGVRMDKVFSKASTKQAMIARVSTHRSIRAATATEYTSQPPPVLALHLN